MNSCGCLLCQEWIAAARGHPGNGKCTNVAGHCLCCDDDLRVPCFGCGHWNYDFNDIQSIHQYQSKEKSNHNVVLQRVCSQGEKELLQSMLKDGYQLKSMHIESAIIGQQLEVMRVIINQLSGQNVLFNIRILTIAVNSGAFEMIRLVLEATICRLFVAEVLKRSCTKY